MKLTLKVWRQPNAAAKGSLEPYTVDGVSNDMSFLEMFDMLNEQLTVAGKEPIAFAHDCREGICGSCSMMINGQAHGPWDGTATCQLHMRAFKEGDSITVEPWRASSFPVIKDLVTNRSAFDRIIQAGGFVSTNTGGARDANEILVPKEASDAAISHLGALPQGQPERDKRALAMVEQMDLEGFGHCTLVGECMAACPKEISIDVIKQMNRDFLLATAKRREPRAATASA